ncbi:SpoIIE family protein phosphatase, partial [Streptomyces sp. NPDC003233]
MTEQPTSFERPQGADPAEGRGALLRTPKPAATPALPAQARAEGTSSGPGTATPCGKGKDGKGIQPPVGKGKEPPVNGPEHSQPATTEPGAHRPRPAPEAIPPRPAPEAIPPQPGAEQERTAARAPGGQERRTGRGLPPGRPMPMRRDGDRLRFVGAATRRIARGLDLDEIVMGLCRATVPTFSDAILVYLRDPLPVGDERPTGPVVLRLRRTDRIPEDRDTDGVLLPAFEPEPEPSALAELSSLTTELCEVHPGGALNEVLRGVRPVFADAPAARAALPELLGECAETVVPSGQHAILAPLRGRRRVIGAALFLRRPDRLAFEGDDLLVAAQLATHSALGIDKAVLYGREAYIADELQRTMLPETLPRPTGVRLASRYLPAAETARVGGDWYDAIPLPGSRVALVVGDVMGHSMTSAAIMGQLRTTAQTLAGLDLPPQEVLHHLDEQAQRLGTDRMATCLYAVYDPVTHRITIANAGHPPPVLLHLGGRPATDRRPRRLRAHGRTGEKRARQLAELGHPP